MEANGGGMTTKDRFEHIDAALLRIEAKLDRKADESDLRAAARRIEMLESGEAPLSKMMLKQFADVTTQVANLTLHGSQNAQELTHRVEKQEAGLAEVRRERESWRSVELDRTVRQDRILRVMGGVLSALTTLALVVSALAAFHTLGH